MRNIRFYVQRKGDDYRMRIQTVQCDITVQKDVEAIVNAANTSLLGDGGVDGAIQKLFSKIFK